MYRYSTSRQWGRLAVMRLEGRDTPAATFQASGAVAGGLPLVEVLAPDGSSVARFEAFEPGFRGGVRAVAAELDGDPNTVEVIAAAGPGGGPHVKVFRINLANGDAVSELASFFAFEPGFTGGVRVASGNVGGPGAGQEII